MECKQNTDIEKTIFNRSLNVVPHQLIDILKINIDSFRIPTRVIHDFQDGVSIFGQFYTMFYYFENRLKYNYEN